MASPDPLVEERNYYLNLLGMAFDDTNLSLAQLREMTGGGANAARSASTPDWIFKNADGTLRSSKMPADFLAQAPSLDDLSNTIRIGAVAAQTIVPIYGCLYPIQIEQVAVVTSTDVASSNVNYWYVDLVRYRSGVPYSFTAKSTKTDASGGQAIAKYQAWNFNQSVFSTYNVADMGDTIAVRFIPVGAPPALADVLITFRATPYSDLVPVNPVPVPLPITDSFTRADSALIPGNTETGQVWEVMDGTWGIKTNQLYIPASAADGLNTLVVDSGTPDCTVEFRPVTATAGAVSNGFALRVTDKNNGIISNGSELYRRQGGVLTLLGTFASGFAANYLARAVMQGGLITIYRQITDLSFIQILQVVETFNLTATKHGIRAGADPTATSRYDDFKVSA